MLRAVGAHQEIAGYEGLHAAAAGGDVATIERLVKRGAALNGRNAYNRTPLIVATFQRQHLAASALIAAGANVNALENSRYDMLTIAAVGKVHRYTKALGQGAKGMKFAVIEEGFGWPASMPEVDATVREAAKRYTKLGATVDFVSFPWHRDAFIAWMGFALDGYYTNLLVGNGFGTNHGGLYLTSLNDKLAGWRQRANEIPFNLRFGMLSGEYLKRQHQGHYYCKAHNLARQAAEAYNRLLEDYDALIMPTAAKKSRPYPDQPFSVEDTIAMALENIENTCPFNLTHHPAITIPGGVVDGCPIGMMLIGRHYDEPTLYRAAHAFEQDVDWTKISVDPARQGRRRRGDKAVELR